LNEQVTPFDKIMKLSIIILCWNDLKVIGDCLRSIYATTHTTEFEIIVSDNGSTDGSIEFIRTNYPDVHLIENGRNLRFARANNVGIRVSRGEYILILNPDTILHEGTIDKVIAIADKHPEAGGFGCRVLNSDGTYQACIRPFPSLRSEWIAALRLGFLGHISEWFSPGIYVGWKGETERTIGWPAGCFILLRGDLLKQLGGFDEQFFYYHEDMDLCNRVWKAGYTVLYTPEATLTHLGGHSTSKRFPPLGFALDGQVTRYRYFYKHFGKRGARQSRWVVLVSLSIRRTGLSLIQLVRPTEYRKAKLELLKTLFRWNYRVDPVRLVENNEEPELGIKPVGRVLER
jgi:GT2 family glycosyltransferase